MVHGEWYNFGVMKSEMGGVVPSLLFIIKYKMN